MQGADCRSAIGRRKQGRDSGFWQCWFNCSAGVFRNGAKIVAVSDSQGGVYHENGFDPGKSLAFIKEHGSVVGMPDTTTITNENMLELECDILIPAALSNQIHAENASKINTKLVVEAANAPTTPQADEILSARGILTK
ncbi:MAG: hypothetical protein DRQ59_16400 [Gammaproteobacteria bacterium]|nr:MAG: hypothetical protein DRQ59_16400 [Gammaproteobacteria bacterium]